ncbi:Cytoplasmic FMR1-interacting protein 2 [Cichlidogyrus casuarinus]|uniref:Cytoplasmic FMR1-interacting protein 2 n=1 Tax=Cichlidogyrus casuarinus TaxID=1844966 RepID=A0ABD2Q0R0_9PLAT
MYSQIMGKNARAVQHEREIMLKEHQKSLEPINILNLASSLEEQNLNPGCTKLAKEMVVLTRERLCCGLVVFEHVLLRMKEFLKADSQVGNKMFGKIACTMSNPWFGNSQEAAEKGDLFDVHGSTEFHRIWSALQFLFSLPSASSTNSGAPVPTTEELFGEGLNWGACTVVFLLGQQGRYDSLDIGSILLRQHRIDRKETLVEDLSLERMASRLNRFSVLNRQIFNILHELLYPKGRVNPPAGAEKIRLFNPPVWNHA